MKKFKINKVGISLFIISSFLSLSLLEATLHISGKYFQYFRETVFISKLDSSGDYYDSERDYEVFINDRESKRVIWTIGDSFTNAGNVSSLESYPAYFYSKLQKEGYPYSVINLGQCEDPTWGTYSRLKEILEESDQGPDLVFFLVGSADPFYYIYSGVDPRTSTREKQRFVNFSDESAGWFKNLHVYKLFRYFKLIYQHKSQSLNGDLLSFEDVSLLEKIYTEITHKYKRGEISEENWGEFYDKVYQVLKNKNSYIDGLVSDFQFESHEKFVFNALITPRVRFYSGKLKYDQALETMMDFAEDYWQYYWDQERGDSASLVTFSNLFTFQSKYTAKDILQYLEKIKITIGELKKGKFYEQLRTIVLERKKFEIDIYNSRLAYWDRIVELSKTYQFKIILLNYGPEFKDANKMMSVVSKKYNLDLIDNHNYFKKLSNEYEHSLIYADDSHFQPLGYRKMAENIFEYLTKKDIIKK